jgi:GNAT superfamily N-acetyltransferase
MPPIVIRQAERPDTPRLVACFEAYMRETYADSWHGSAAALARDALGRRCRLALAVGPDEAPLGFLGWMPSYDLHHCMAGGEVLDLYVTPSARGQGIALRLACHVAGIVHAQGGGYLKGGAVDSRAARRLYARIAVFAPNGECRLSGHAFRQLASLAHRPLRRIIPALPPLTWNYEA